MEAAQTALHLLGNASDNISRERRRAAIANMNYRLVWWTQQRMTCCLRKQHQTFLATGLQRKPKSVTKSLNALTMPLFRGEIKERLVWMAGIRFSDKPLLLSAPGERHQLLQGQRTRKRSCPPPPPIQSTGSPKERTEEPTKKKRRTGHTRTQLSSMVKNTSILYVYPNLPLVMSILLKEKYLTNLFHSLIIKQLIELGMSPLAQTAAGQNLPLAGRVSHFIKKLGDNHTGPLSPQLRKGLYNKPTEQASPTCPSQGAQLLKRGNSEHLQGGSEHGRKECNIQSL